MSTPLKKSMNAFFKDTGTRRGSFWKAYIESLGYGLDEVTRLDRKIGSSLGVESTRMLIPGVDGSNCHLLAGPRNHVVTFMKPYLPSAKDVFVGRCWSMTDAAVADCTSRYIAISHYYTSVISVYSGAFMYYERCHDEAAMDSLGPEFLDELRQNFEKIAKAHKVGEIGSLVESDFVQEVRDDGMAHLTMAAQAETWMIAHEFGHLLAKKERARLASVTAPMITSMRSTAFLENEYSIWSRAWREEFCCDLLGVQFLMQILHGEHPLASLVARITGALFCPALALLSAEKLAHLDDAEVDSHPDFPRRIVMLTLTTISFYGKQILAEGIVRSHPGGSEVFYMASSLLEFLHWVVTGGEFSIYDFPGVRSDMSFREATEFRYKTTHHFLVELASGDVAEEYEPCGSYWLRLGQ